MTQSSYTPSFTDTLVRWLYSLVVLLLVILFPLLRLALKKVNIRLNKERFGIFKPKKPLEKGGLLLHCASVGEVVAASVLVNSIRQRHPAMPITMTTTTETGAEEVEKQFKGQVTHYYLPFDLPGLFSRLIVLLQPRHVLITEVELWPNMIHQCWQHNIPVSIVNARLTDSSRLRYQKWPSLFFPMLQQLTTVCAQGQRDYRNYQQWGISDANLVLTHNMKFDLALSEDELEMAKQLQASRQLTHRTILLGASTHAPEESALIRAYQRLKPNHPELLLVLVPRHPQRFAEVETLLAPLNWKKLSDTPEISDAVDGLLVDQMGVLKSFYGFADIAFVGGSLAARGGHNALEAALFSKPVIMGPSTHNNPMICNALAEAGALQIIQDETSLNTQIATWLDNPGKRTTAGEAGLSVIHANRGAIEKTLQVLNL